MTAPIRDQLQAALGQAYLIDRELGGGGMSRVFVATETALNRSVVIKVITPELLEGMSAERFAREVRLAARLQHANIVPVLTAGDANGLPYYTMPYVRGESLRARMASGTPITVPDAIHLLRDIARALACAHAEGIVHRDIKPENVLLSGGAAVVADFGIAKAIDLSRTQDGDPSAATSLTLTQAGSSLGTPAYMAPEQATGDPGVDHRADIYAWGLIAWELLAGRHPFAGRTTLQAIIAAQITENPPALSAVRADVPAALSDVIRRALEKNPAHRPATAAELLAALDQAASTGAPHPLATAPPRRSNMRRRALVGAAAVAVIAATVWLAVGRLHHRSEPPAGKSLAVIPFTPESSDTANAYLGEGIANDVTSTLAEVPGLRLAGQSSSARFVGSKLTPQQIGQTLQVSAILDGTVRRVGDQVRVSVELLDTGDGHVIWQESYAQPAKDILTVQDEIARAIAGQLQVTLADAGSSEARGTADPVAYDLYLKGMYLYRRRGPGITTAIATLEQATARDTMFARGWAALSNALTVSTSYVATRPSEVLPRARAAAERAVRLDSTLSDAHLALGYVDAELFQWPEAEAELRRAIALDPAAAEPRYRLAYTLMNQGKPAEAVPILQLAVARDPLYFMTASYLGWAEVESGRVAEGIEEERRGVALEPESITAVSIAGLGMLSAGLKDSAIVYGHRILSLSSMPARLGVAAVILAHAGEGAEARAITQQIEATPPDTWTRWTGLVLAYTALGDSARAVAALERAAAGDGDDFPTYALRLLGELPTGPRVSAALLRYHLDPAHFTKAAGTTP
ncbi:MAG TPA: protein kinase [Gemmatimonadales bacterium]|jgi:serine/threonine-protein kinase